jgi:aspartate carbamoyltransferase regulatory subunit
MNEINNEIEKNQINNNNINYVDYGKINNNPKQETYQQPTQDTAEQEQVSNTQDNMENKEYKQMKLGRIKDGTVIDHIPPELCFRLINVLGLEKYGSVLSAATNLTSAKLDKKGMIKISGKFLTEDEVKRVAVVAPNVTMCTVNDYKVLNKAQLTLPKEIKTIVLCNNPNCMTNVEEVSTNFNVINNSPLKIRCNYCERTIEKEDIKLK